MKRSTSGPSLFRSENNVVIVGYGHAGRIHKKAYDGLASICTIAAVVELNLSRSGDTETSLRGVKIYQELGEALRELGGDVIVDFCVPAKINLELVETALRYGITKFLIEKPLGWDVASTKKLVAKLSGSEVVYLDTYAASMGIQQLLKEIGQQNSAPKRVDVVFHKNRVQDSRLKRGFVDDAVPNAWMIEGPHMLSIARQISGEITHVSEASTFDMKVGGDQILPEHGGGHAVLEHNNRTTTHLDLNMCSDRNERRIDVQLSNDVRMTVNLPPSKTTEQISTLEVLYPTGVRKIYRTEDRPMENCVQNAIRHLNGKAVAVSSLSDGLAVCAIVERMTERKQFWQSVPKQWKHFGAPLRPCAEDIKVMEDQVVRWAAESSVNGCNVLLCGVTPEIAGMEWPAGTRLWAVEKSQAMIDEVWPAKESTTQQACIAEWTRLPFKPGSFDIIIGDGCLSSLAYPQKQLEFFRAMRNVIRCDGLLIMRFFIQRDEPERPESVFKDLAEGRIGNFHVFKWRLTMSLQTTASEGVRVNNVWQAWNDAGVITDWPHQEVETIETYKGSDHRLTFTTMQEIREVHAPFFEERECIVPGYELGERCPILVYSPR